MSQSFILAAHHCAGLPGTAGEVGYEWMADSWWDTGLFSCPSQHDLTQHKRAVKPVPCTVPLHWAEQPDMSEAYLKAVILKALSGCN